MYFSNLIGVAKSDTPVFTWQSHTKLLERFQWLIDGNGTVQYNREDSLCSTSIVDDLPSEEQIFVLISDALPRLWVFGPFEEKDESIDGFESIYKCLIVQAVKFLHLYIRHTDLRNQLSKDTRIRFNGTPLIEHLL
jgi:hypothetical protein